MKKGNNNFSDFQMFQFDLGLSNKYMPSNFGNTTSVYHYTSPEGFTSIIKNDSVKLWASRYDCLNDKSEGTVATEAFRESCDLLRDEIPQEMYDLFITIEPSKKIFLSYHDDKAVHGVDAECDRYICSFSNSDDSLAMWNYYSKGNKYEGFNIGFYTDSILQDINQYYFKQRKRVSGYNVVYDRAQQISVITEFIEDISKFFSEGNITRIAEVAGEQLTDWSLVFKYDYFSHEQEARIVVDIPKKEQDIPVYFRLSKGMIVPYIELIIDPDTIDSVGFGPLTATENQQIVQKEIMERYIAKCNCRCATVEFSKIPVRF